MKKLLAAASIVCTICASMIAANAQDKYVTITVDHRDINFTDQVPVIEQDRVMVPLRDVFVAMGAKVEWNGEDRKVTINSKDNRTRLIFYIDNPEFKKLYFVTLLNVESKKLTSDVAPKIINDRTMLPLRVISENFDADVNWDPETYTVTIASKQFKKVLAVETYEEAKYTEFSKKLPCMALTADKETVAAGDSVTVSVDISNVTPGKNLILSGASVSINYDTQKFEYTGCKAIGETEEEEPYAISDNAAFRPGVAKAVFVLDPTVVHEMKDRKLIELTFKAKTAGEAEFSIADTFTAGNNDNFISMFKGDNIVVFDSADLLYLNTDSVKVAVDGEAAVEDANKNTEEVNETDIAEESIPADDEK